jgi:hypothetical protein
MKAKRERKQQRPQKWRDCCGLSAAQWAYAAQWPDYLDWAFALEAARLRKQANDVQSPGSSTRS